MKATIDNLQGETERVSLPEPHYLVSANHNFEEFTGVVITALYSGPRSRRRVAQTDSIWDNGRHGVVGTTYRELEENEYLHYCRLVDVEPRHVAATDL